MPTTRSTVFVLSCMSINDLSLQRGTLQLNNFKYRVHEWNGVHVAKAINI